MGSSTLADGECTRREDPVTLNGDVLSAERVNQGRIHGYHFTDLPHGTPYRTPYHRVDSIVVHTYAIRRKQQQWLNLEGSQLLTLSKP